MLALVLNRLPRWHRWRLVLSLLFLALVIAWTLAPDWFAPGDPIAGVITQRLQPPSAAHWFGTDQLGRDLYTRVVHGTALSMEATVIALALAFVASTVIGVTAGYLGGRIDEGFMRVVDVLLSIPSLLVSLMLISALGFGTMNIALAVGIASIASFARVTRSQVLKVCSAPYIEAARAYGAPWYVICTRHVFPHARGPVLALLSVEFGAAILSISALSFLGYGAVPPTPEWGNLVADGRSYLATAWWLTTLPGLVIVATVLAVNGVGRAARPADGSRAR
ncbi:ABC transporter permease [Burkholderia multivorans]|uniref:ABC transporter permease n=1 Tax=Burkholderia multivorans TaxID=87883 RepID=UPI00373574E8